LFTLSLTKWYTENMNHTEQIKQDSIKEFGSDVTREKYTKNAEAGFWESEKILVDKYFKQD